MKVLSRFLILLLAPAVVLALLYGWVVLRSPAPDSAPLVRTVDERLAWVGDPVTVRLHFNGDRLPAAPPTGDERYVVQMVLDHSSSMGSGMGSPLGAAVQAASYFAQVVASPEQPVGVLAFDHVVKEVHPIGTDGTDLAEAIRGIESGGGTDIAGAVEAGRQSLMNHFGSGKDPEARGLLVLLSDGESSHEEALAAAARAKGDHIRILTIGLGMAIDDDLLRRMASSPTDYRQTLDADTLGELFLNIAGNLAPVVGHAATLEERYHYGAFELGEFLPGFQPQHDPDTGRIQVDLPVLFARRFELPYVQRARHAGLFSAGLDRARLTFIPDLTNPTPEELTSNPTPQVLVLSWPLLILLWLPALAYLAWRLLRPRPKVLEQVEVVTKGARPRSAAIPQRRLAPPLRYPEPVLFVGVGEAGRALLRREAAALVREPYLGAPAQAPFAFLGIDGREPDSGEEVVGGPFQGWWARLPSNLGGAVERFVGEGTPSHLEWLPMAELRQVGAAELDLSRGARGNRWVPRLALFEALARRDPVFWEPWCRALAWLRSQDSARVLLAGAVESGTAGGVMVDLAHLLRSALPPEQRSRVAVYGVALADLPTDHGAAGANQTAFLSELDREQLAARWPRPGVYDPKAQGEEGYLNTTLEEPPFTGLFLLQAPSGGGEEESFLEQVAAFAHTLTESGAAAAVGRHLHEVRSGERALEAERLESAVESAAIYRLRFPARELAEGLRDRFAMDVIEDWLRTGDREPAADLRQAERFLLDHPPAGNGLAVGLESAFLHCAVGEESEAVAEALRRRLGGRSPERAELRQGLGESAAAWIHHFLNGSEELSEAEATTWRAGRLGRLRAVLQALLHFCGQARRRGLGSGVEGDVLEVLEEVYRGYGEAVEAWHRQLVEGGEGKEGESATVLERLATNRRRLEQRLAAEARQSWAEVLRGEEGTPWSEATLYQRHGETYLQQHHRLRLHHDWQVAWQDGHPRLDLQLVTVKSGLYAANAAGAEALLADLRSAGRELFAPVAATTIIERLRRDDGTPDLSITERWLADLRGGVEVERHGPAADCMARHVLLLAPPLPGEERHRLEAEMERLSPLPVAVVEQHDPHSLRLLVLDAILPISSLRLRHRHATPRLGEAVLSPWIFLPERRSEALREQIEKVLGVAPCPPFHPLVRLLLAAPLPFEDLAALLAEGAVERISREGRPTVVIRDGVHEEGAAPQRHPDSLPLALLQISHRTVGQSLVPEVLRRFQQRSKEEQQTRRRAAVENWRELAASEPEGIQRQVVEQIVLLLDLEAELARRELDAEVQS
jgi:hypothetical protein